MKYAKVPLNPVQHINLLRIRGLEIQHEAWAINQLSNIGYYRLTGYMYHLQKRDGTHVFIPGITFEDIIQHYRFDKKLRSLILEYLERIEVALRAKLTDQFSQQHGFFWYADRSFFDDMAIYNSINEEIRIRFTDPQERFLKSFKIKYTTESLPPSNMAMEVLSMGKLARLFKGLSNNEEKNQIAYEFGLPSTILTSWFIYLNNVRNICAHHARLWNRTISADRPTIPTRQKYKFNGTLPPDFNTSLYGVISMIDRLLSTINTGNSFIPKILHLIDQYPNISTASMGFPDNWKDHPAWGDR